MMIQKLWKFSLLMLIAMFTVTACAGEAPAPALEPTAEPAPTEAPAEEEEETTVEEETAVEEEAPAAETVPAGDYYTPELTKEFEGTTITAFLGEAANDDAYPNMVAAFEEATGITVEVVVAPESATDNLAQQLQFLGAGSSDIDVYQIDVIWPGVLAQHALDLSDRVSSDLVAEHFPAIVENNTVNGKLVGIPWYTDAGLLYYRTDLLEKYGYAGPPATWDELEEMAATIQAGERTDGNDSFWGFVWQGNNYEGLTCDALEWQYSHNGGSIIEPDGTITVNNPNAAAAFNRAASWVDTISPPGVTTYQEEDARGVWQTGNAAFMRNWPYAYSLGNSEDSAIAGTFEATVLPTAATNNAATLGGWQLMVSQYSESPDASVLFVEYLASYEQMKSRAITNSFLPTIGALYSDADVLEAQPFMGSLFDVFNNAVARPSTVTGELYNEVSAAYFNAVHSILTGEEVAEDALLDLEDDLIDITGFEVGDAPDSSEAASGGTLTGDDASPVQEADDEADDEATEQSSAPAGDYYAPELTDEYAGSTLNIFFGSVGDEVGSYGQLIADFEAATGIDVEIIYAPESATDNLAQQLQFLGAGSSDIDVYQIDVIWPGILAQHALDLSDRVSSDLVGEHFSAIVENNTVEGKLVAMPWYTDAGLLYYRTDLLEKYGYAGPPATWDELEEMAATIQAGERAEGSDSFWGFVWQGNNYEGLTCDALEWQYSHNGGRIIEPDGTITVNNPNAAAAFNRAASWIDTISPPGSTTYQEEDARGVWQTGNAAFMRNWPYAYSLGNSDDSVIAGNFEATVLPTAATNNAATLGGWQLMVSEYSENQDAAVLFVEYMTSYEQMKSRAITNSYLPTIGALYSDTDLLESQPFMGSLFDVFNNAVARPSTVTGDLYNEVSAAYFNAVHSILTGEETAEDALLDLEDDLVDITGFEVGDAPDSSEAASGGTLTGDDASPVQEADDEAPSR